MAKRKLEDALDETLSKKIKLTIDEVNDNRLTDTGFQNINEDVSDIIINRLKFSFGDLTALRSTCSSWRNRIDSIIAKDFRHFAPLAHQDHGIRYRIGFVRQCYLRPTTIVDLRLFDFDKDFLGTDPNMQDLEVHVVPWAPQFLFIMVNKAFAIVNTADQKVIKKFEEITARPFEEIDSVIKHLSCNAQRKEVAISYAIKYDDIMHASIFVYNINDTGNVKLVTGPVRSDHACEPTGLFLASDGTIWRSWEDYLKVYSIDEKREQIAKVMNLNGMNVIGVGEFNGNVTVFVVREGILGRFDTATQEITDLPECDYFDFFTVQNNLVLALVHKKAGMHHLMALYDLNSNTKLPFMNTTNSKSDVSVLSPDGSTVFRMTLKEISFISVTDNTKITCELQLTLKGNTTAIWIDNKRVLVVIGKKLAVVDASMTTIGANQFWELPNWGIDITRHHMVAGKILHVVKMGEENGSLSMYRIQLE